jgi:hypothetical protein
MTGRLKVKKIMTFMIGRLAENVKNVSLRFFCFLVFLTHFSILARGPVQSIFPCKPCSPFTGLASSLLLLSENILQFYLNLVSVFFDYLE